MSKLTEQGELALKKQSFLRAKQLFKKAFDLSQSDNKQKQAAGQSKAGFDPYIVHRYALTTYKAEKPNAITALKESLQLLENLDLNHTNDPETVALAGAIEKKLYERKKDVNHLSRSILYHERGYYLLNNRYNAINLAYVLNCRVESELDNTREEKIADLINAKRIRERVLFLCKKDWADIMEREKKMENENGSADRELFDKYNTNHNIKKFWIWINLAEAYFGLGKFEDYEHARNEAKALPHEPWMLSSLDNQVKKLEKLLEKSGQLIHPAWKKPG